MAWADRYGCPDCVDQGAYRLTVKEGADTRTTLLDPRQHPTSFDPLLAFFADVFAAYPAPACYSPTQNLDSAYTPGATGCPCVADIEADGCFSDSTGRRVRSMRTRSRCARITVPMSL